MKKKCNSSGLMKIRLRKKLLTMKFFVLFFLLSVSVSATTYSQDTRLTLSLEDVSLTEVFSAIRKNTAFTFIYNVDDVRSLRVKSLNVKDATVQQILDKVLVGTGFIYRIEDEVIVLLPQELKEKKKSVRVKGFVYDMQKQPLPGVTVKVVGVAVGTATNEKGWFAIDLPMQSGSLEFSFVGFKKKVIEFSEKTTKDTLHITLEEDVQSLDETVVVAYGTTTKREATGSISVVKAKELEGIPSSSIANLLQGRVAGLDITNMSGSPGAGGTSIVIRGYNSLDQDLYRRFSNPLWVVDGVPMNSFTSPVTGTNMLADLNPDMIESVQVLKDASAASIYGSRAANGVIIVTTKKGKKGQDATFSANVSYTWSVLPELPPVTIGRGERDLRRYRQKWRSMKAYMDPNTMSYVYPTTHKEVYDHKYTSRLDYYWIPDPAGNRMNGGGILQDSLNDFYNNSTNFFPVYYRTGKVTNANIQTYAGSERMNYSIGLGFYDETGVLRGTGYTRVDLSSSMTVRPVKKLSVDMLLNATLANRKRGDHNRNDIEVVPGDPYELSSLKPGEGTAVWNEVLEKLNGSDDKNRSVRLRANFRLTYDICERLLFSTSGAADYMINRRNYFQPSTLNSSGYSKSTGETGINLMVLNENTLNYKKSFNEKHNMNLLVGFSYQYDQLENNMGYAQNSPSDKIHYAPTSLPLFGSEVVGGYTRYFAFKDYTSDMQEKILLSYFFRAEYNYLQKYLFSLSLRADGSSTFGKNNKWGYFPSVAGAWAFSEERFFASQSHWLSFGKIRASWGRSGMDFDHCYLAQGLLEVGNPSEGNSSLQPNYKEGLYNDDLSWEQTDQYDFGLDLDMFDNRFGIVVDYYYRYTNKMLASVALPGAGAISGFVKQWRNAAALSNEGLELLVKYEIFRTPDLYWKISVNGARNWNKLRETSDGRDLIGVIGRSINDIKVLKTEGFIDYQDDIPAYWRADGYKAYLNQNPTSYYKPGDYKYVDLNGDGTIDGKDVIYVGSALPIFSGGLVSEFKWKDFDINLSMAYQMGRHMINAMPIFSLQQNEGVLLYDARKITFWNQPGDNADYPFAAQATVVDRDVEKVNWLKLKTLTIGYSLPRAWMAKVGLKQVRFFASGENLLTFSNYSGLDPETVDIRTGYDGGRNYPLARKFTLGLTVKF